MADVVGGGTTNVSLYDEQGNLLGTEGAPLVASITGRTLTERMFAKAPASGYSLWIDTADLTYIYLAEGPTASGPTDETLRGIRVTKDATGSPLGKVEQATDFAWNNRGGATWA